jgi:hypothetical protein
MLKKEIRSLIFNLLPKYDKSGKYHFRLLDAAIERVLIEMYQEVFYENPLALQRFTKPYGYTTALTVISEATTGLYYTNVPAQYVVFKDKSSGIRRVSTPVQGAFTFFPMDQREMDFVQNGSNVDAVTTKIGYVVTPTRVEYYNMSGAVLTSGVRMDVIIPFSVYLDTDEVLIPESLNKESGEFEDRVLKILGVIQPVDLKDDNAEKQVANG